MNAILVLLAGVLGLAEVPVREMTIRSSGDFTEVSIVTEGRLEIRHFNMEGPYRLVLDLIGAEHALPARDFPAVNRGGIVAVRSSQYSPEVVRIVFELDRLLSYTAETGDGFVRLAFEGIGTEFDVWTTAAVVSQPEATNPDELVAGNVATALASPVVPQVAQESPRITVTFSDTPLIDAIFTISDLAGQSIIAGKNVNGTVNAQINDRPWEEALKMIVEGQGYIMYIEDEGVIQIVEPEAMALREEQEPLETVVIPVRFATAAEVQETLEPIKSVRGLISSNASSNKVVITDVPRVIASMRAVIDSLDVQPPEVEISAQIIFINRTSLEEMGITYDLKDSQGNQLNQLNPGAADLNGDGIISLPEEQVDVGTNVISLGGSSIAALGNANDRIANPTVQLLTTLIIGRHSLIGFVEALESVNVSEVDSRPMIRTVNNVTARIQVGVDVPIRVLDQGASVVGEGALSPTAQVSVRQTGVILIATPHVTPDGMILLDLIAENSSVTLQSSDIAATFPTQRAETRVLVESGERIVIAGLVQEEISEVRSGIPLLQNLPLIGRLFQVRRQRSATLDLMILVTPTLIPRGG